MTVVLQRCKQVVLWYCKGALASDNLCRHQSLHPQLAATILGLQQHHRFMLSNTHTYITKKKKHKCIHTNTCPQTHLHTQTDRDMQKVTQRYKLVTARVDFYQRLNATHQITSCKFKTKMSSPCTCFLKVSLNC